MEEKITSLFGFIQSVWQISETLQCDQEFNETFYFRGQSNINYELIPKVGRQRNMEDICNYERNLIEAAKYKLPTLFNDNSTPINQLALLQHYGIPTRLLDVTSNPLVALFFSCEESEEDGEVIVFKNNETDLTTYPVFNAIADSYRFAMTSFTNLSVFYEKVIKQLYFSEQEISLRYNDAEAGARWIKECCDDLLFVHAKELSDRQKNQQGSFILFHNKIKDNSEESYFINSIEAIDKKNDKSIMKRYVISKEYKKTILKQLSLCGITKSILFPEDLDYICKEIAEKQLRFKNNKINTLKE